MQIRKSESPQVRCFSLKLSLNLVLMSSPVTFKFAYRATRFFISNTFINNARLKLAKIQANAKQHPEAELLFENYSHSSSRNHSKIIANVLRNKQKKKCVCNHEIRRLIIMKIKIEMKNRSHRYDINRPRSRHGHKYSKYKKYNGAYMYKLS